MLTDEFLHLQVFDSHNDYFCPATWISWDAASTEAYDQHGPTPRLLGATLVGPSTTVSGLGAWILSQSSRPSSNRLTALWPTATAAAAPDLDRPAYFQVYNTPWIRRHAPVAWAPHKHWLQAVVFPASAQTLLPGADLPNDTVLAHWGDPADWTHTVWLWLQNQPIPLDPAWEAPFFAHLSDSPITIYPLPAWSIPGASVPLLIQIRHFDPESFHQYIQTGLQARWWSIPQGTGPNPQTLPQPQDGPDAYLAAWAPALTAQLDTLVVPRVTAGTPQPPEWSRLLRTPHRAQGDVIQAASATLQSEPYCILMGEPGVGKTLMMSTIPWDRHTRLHQHSNFRVLVVAPDHLLKKWAREIRDTIPNATTHALNSWQDVLRARAHWNTPPTHPEYWIIGRDRAKYSYRTQFAGRWSSHDHCWYCPDCGQALHDPDSNLLWGHKISRNTKTRKCADCGTSLWAADPTLRRISPGHLLRRYARHRFDYAIFDELQDYTGSTEQGQLLAWGSQIAKKVIAGTGSYVNGYASNLHLVQFRLNPASMIREGIAHNDSTATQRRYGRMQETAVHTEETDENLYGRRAHVRKYQKALPGISPLWYATKMIAHTISIRLEDLGADALPPYQETVHWIPMSEPQSAWYHRVVNDLGSIAREALVQGSQRYLGALLNTSLTLADEPWRTITVSNPEGEPYTWVPPAELTEALHYPKEAAILAHVQDELAHHRKVWIYTTFTTQHPQGDRLLQRLQDAGIRVAQMTTHIPRPQREAWVAEQVAAGIDVIISHPGLVETGLDLIDFPTILWNSTGYRLTRLRQASRRAWRIGQTAPCTVHFYAYEDTMEQTALQLMAKKLDAALPIEGDLSLEGLQRIIEQQGDDNAMIRALAYGIDQYDVTNIWNQAPAVTRTSLAIPLAFPASPELTIVPAFHTPRKRRTRPITPSEPTLGQWTWNFG